ncbi:radical SAM protein [bacterium]|nr:radical SAM protein [bacterium]QQR58691.1 MAG: radical SAM protein [Candidatus Melainabacteria bacterium]
MFKDEIRLAPYIDKRQAAIELAWCFPGTYSIGMTGLGYQLVWWLMEQDPQVLVKRCFTDMDEGDLSRCRYFGFTLSWELDFINMVHILDKYRIERDSSTRSDNDPIVFGGGPVLTANPEPFAHLFDVILLGDAEKTVPAFIDCLKNLNGNATRREKLEALAVIPGIYIPSAFEFSYQSESGPISDIRPNAQGLNNQPQKLIFKPPVDYIAQTQILSPKTTWGDSFLMEIIRSCPQECGFCLASYLTKPVRFTSVDTIGDTVDRILPYTKKVGLLGPSISEHPKFLEILETLYARVDQGLQVTIASVRADTITEPIARKLSQMGQRSITIAIESGSQRLRDLIRKNLTTKEIEDCLSAAEEGGLQAIKFYGMVGLPYEEQADLDETVALMTRLKKTHKKLKLTLGVSSFVPKAQTPFQWLGRDEKAGDKIEFMRKAMAKIGIEVRPESNKWSDIQALLSRGDRRLTPILNTIDTSNQSLGSWRKALRERSSSCPDLQYYAYREIPRDEILPWSHLSTESNTAMLLQKLAK